MRRSGYAGGALVIAGLILLAGPPAWATDSVWVLDGNGSWTEPTHWSPKVPPDGPGDWALLDINLSQPITITLDAPITLGTLLLADWNNMGMTLAPGTGGTLTFDGGGNDAEIVGFGRHEIQAPVTLAESLWLNNTDEGGLALALGGRVAGGVGCDLVVEGLATDVTLTAPDNAIQGTVIVGPKDGRGGLVLAQDGRAPGVSHFEAHLGATIWLDNLDAAVAPSWPPRAPP
ncbi:MAG TPA: hypothetical protein VM431_03010 [Phycisphaerae bacterium]|nr:hypothetical protein [Phycisphaerae bacterium]